MLMNLVFFAFNNVYMLERGSTGLLIAQHLARGYPKDYEALAAGLTDIFLDVRKP